MQKGTETMRQPLDLVPRNNAALSVGFLDSACCSDSSQQIRITPIYVFSLESFASITISRIVLVEICIVLISNSVLLTVICTEKTHQSVTAHNVTRSTTPVKKPACATAKGSPDGLQDYFMNQQNGA